MLFFITGMADANNTYFCSDKSIESIPIQQNGRVKPLLVHASETIKILYGKAKFKNFSAIETYCLLSLKSFSVPIPFTLKTRIDHIEVRKLLNNEDKWMNYPKLISNFNLLRNKYMSLKINNSYKKSIAVLLDRISIYQDVTNGSNWLLADQVLGKIRWIPLTNIINSNDLLNNRSIEKILKTKTLYIQKTSDKYLLEIFYAKSHLVGWALLLTMLAMASLILFKNFNIALGFSVLTLISEISLIILRVMISGRAPVTNMYETMIFSGLGGLILALVIGHFKKDKIIVLVGLAFNLMTLFMITFAHGMFSSSIGPLVPVLRDNFWLSTHVTTIILSYGALALSWVLANYVLITKRFFSINKDDLKNYSDITYTCLKYGTVLLAAGIILGGVWADYSWGRFWGWDPKETWSLIVLFIYIAILHGKSTSWITPKRFFPLTAAAFMSVMMAWFGVNYILASGLHSYGFSEGGAIFLFSFFIIQTLIIIITFLGPEKINEGKI